MKDFKDLVKTKGFILATIQNDLYGEVSTYMNEKDLNQTKLAQELKVSKSYISQVLNGNFNYTISKLIDLSLAIGKIPSITFKDIKSVIDEATVMESKKTLSTGNAPKLHIYKGNEDINEHPTAA